MRIFVQAAELGSFTAVAEATGLSGPMVGKHVSALEHSVGGRLINRTTRRQSLTELGRNYYERCKDILADIDALDAFAADASGIRGKLRVSMPVHFGRHCVAPILVEMAREYPELELDLSFSDQLLDLAQGGFDLVVRTGTLENRGDHVARRVARQRMIVCGAPAYFDRCGNPRSLSDLNRYDCVLYAKGDRVAPWLFPTPAGEVRQMRIASRLRMDDLDAIADATEAGAGLAWLPLWLVQARLTAGSLVQVLRDQGDYLYDCHAVWLTSPYMPAKVRLAIDRLARQLPKRVT